MTIYSTNFYNSNPVSSSNFYGYRGNATLTEKEKAKAYMVTKITKKNDELPISLRDIKGFLKIDHDGDDALLTKLVISVSGMLEEWTHKSFSEIEVEVKHWNNVVLLPYTPILQIMSVTKNGKRLNKIVRGQLFQDGYSEIIEHGIVVGIEAPFNRKKDEEIVVQYAAGYNQKTLPKAIYNSIISSISNIYYNREDFDKFNPGKIAMLQPHMTYELG